MRLNMGRFRGCFDAALRRRPGMSGRVTLRFTIDRSGLVSKARAVTLMSDRDLARCLTSKTYELAFSLPVYGVVDVSYPLVLTPPEALVEPPLMSRAALNRRR
jgi:hypothetical protein